MFSLKTPAFIIGSRQIRPFVNYIVSKTQISIASSEKISLRGEDGCYQILTRPYFDPVSLSRCLTVSLSLDFSHSLSLSVLLGLMFSPNFTLLLSPKKLKNFSSHTFLLADTEVKITPACFSGKHVFPQNSVVHYPPVGPQKNFPKKRGWERPMKKVFATTVAYVP